MKYKLDCNTNGLNENKHLYSKDDIDSELAKLELNKIKCGEILETENYKFIVHEARENDTDEIYYCGLTLIAIKDDMYNIIEIFNKNIFNITDEAGNAYNVIDENDFKEIADDILKLKTNKI